MSTLYKTALIIIIIGALNLGLVGLFQFDLVAELFDGQDTVVSRVIYTIFGLSGLVSIGLLLKPPSK
ncbi:DUF378 domain-containing protein [Bacillus sp. JJ722]|uniref:DUF378 domain-containing protein n=1 Tax=Bacillus sp. JJ722 TaxID=3122973 RepID=UPI00300007AC